MALNIFRALNVQQHERGIVFLLLIQSVFLGIFAGALDVGANALFLEAYSADEMPKAFMVSGLVGILFTSVYTFLQKRMKFSLFTALNLLLAVIIVSILRIGYGVSSDPRLSFALLVIMGPVIIISMLGFWGTAGRYFTLREGKRLFGLIDTGSVIGMILAFYSVPVLVRFNFNVHNTLLISAISLLLALALQLIVLSRYKFKTEVKKVEKAEKKQGGIVALFKRKYTAVMAFFVVLSVITGFIIHYCFMSTTEVNYPDNKELTGFLGLFFGTMMISTVILKSTLYAWLMKNFGLRVTLLISPVLLLILSLAASLVGGFSGAEGAVGTIGFFFLLVALVKLFNKALKDAIESPSMKILYQSLDQEERFNVQAQVDGIVNELTAFSAGLLMAGLLLVGLQVIHFVYILVVVLLAWIWLGVALYRNYRKNLNDALSTARKSASNIQTDEDITRPVFNENNLAEEQYLLNPYVYHYSVLEDDYWESIPDSVLKKTEKKMHITESVLKGISIEKSQQASLPFGKQKILEELAVIVEKKDLSKVPFIISLLREKDLFVRAAAIEAAGKLNVKELGSYLVDYLGDSELYMVAWTALVSMGEMILDNLENAFHKTGVDSKVRLRIVKAMAAINTSEAHKQLFKKIDFHEREIREAAVKYLYNASFMPDNQQVQALEGVIFDVCKAGAWNLAAEYTLTQREEKSALAVAMKEEKKRNDNLLFNLLGICYEKSTIDHIRRSFETQSDEDSGFALEMLNLIVDEQVFLYLEPYLDDIAITDRIKKLQNEMPVEILDYNDLLLGVINRDGLYLGNYPRICAIMELGNLEEKDVGKYLAAQVFHPNTGVSSVAAKVLESIDGDLFSSIERRIEENRLKHSWNVDSEYHGLQFIRKVEELGQWNIFKDVDKELLLSLVQLLYLDSSVDYKANDRLILFRTEDFTADAILQEGLLIILSSHPKLLEHINYLASRVNCSIYQVDIPFFRELLFDREELLEKCNQFFSKTVLKEEKLIN